MIEIKVTGIEDVKKMLGDLSHKMPSVIARGLTITAQDAKKQVAGWLPRQLDRPTPYTMRSLFVFPAEKNDLRAAVAFKSEGGRLGRHMMDRVQASRSMLAQVYGGARRLKDSEKTLLRNGITRSNRPYLIPAKGAKIDRYGNVPGSFMNKVLYQGVAMGSASQGYARPLNNRKNTRHRRSGQYFVMQRGGAPVGIYQNKGRQPPMPVFLFSAKANYRSRVPFESMVTGVVNRQLSKRINESIEVVLAKYRRS
jgi:hypothetical protein